MNAIEMMNAAKSLTRDVKEAKRIVFQGDRNAVTASRAAMERDANEFGGQVVEAECRLCDEPMHGLVAVDGGDVSSASGPGVPVHLYLVSFVRNCNCDVPMSLVESALIGAAIIERENAA